MSDRTSGVILLWMDVLSTGINKNFNYTSPQLTICWTTWIWMKALKYPTCNFLKVLVVQDQWIIFLMGRYVISLLLINRILELTG